MFDKTTDPQLRIERMAYLDAYRRGYTSGTRVSIGEGEGSGSNGTVTGLNQQLAGTRTYARNLDDRLVGAIVLHDTAGQPGRKEER